MKSAESNSFGAGITDQDESRDADGVQQENQDHAGGEDDQGMREAAFAAKEPEPHGGEGQDQTGAFQSGAAG